MHLAYTEPTHRTHPS